MQKTIDNPCYHCYTGATGQCNMTPCKHQFERWSKDLESEEIEIDFMTVGEAYELLKQKDECLAKFRSGERNREDCFLNKCDDCKWTLSREELARDMAIRSLRALDEIMKEIECSSMINKGYYLEIVKRNLQEVVYEEASN